MASPRRLDASGSGTPPPTYSSRPAARPPQRVGAPPSTRNFKHSSASGPATSPQAIPPRFAKPTPAASTSATTLETSARSRNEGQAKRDAWGAAYIPEEDSIRNDYSTHYVRTGSRPQNHLRGSDVANRFSEYPKLCALLRHKHALVSSPDYSIPPTFLAMSPSEALPVLQPNRFDVVLISPPPSVKLDELQAIDISRLASTPGFVWLWVGTGVRGNGIGLEKGRELLAAWGYRRCEDIVWLKTNQVHPAGDLISNDPNLFKSTVEHCLMGIRGTVRRSNDPWFVHCNVDTDVIIWEGNADDSELKPPELQSLIENFCLGTRRLHLFGSSHSARRGWLTVGEALSDDSVVLPVEGEKTAWDLMSYERESYAANFRQGAGNAGRVPVLLPFVEELDDLRPKSPPLRNGQASSGGLGRGRGAGLGVTRSTMIPHRGGFRGGPAPPPSIPHLPSAPHQHPYPNHGYAPPPPFYPPSTPQYPAYQYSQHPSYHLPHQQQQQYYPSQQAYPSQFSPNPYQPYPSAAPQDVHLFHQWLAMGGPQMMGVHADPQFGVGQPPPQQWTNFQDPQAAYYPRPLRRPSEDRGDEGRT